MLMIALLALADPAIGEIKTFGDWAVACDNTHACEMTSLLAANGDWGEGDPVFASVARAGGPRGGFDVTIDTAETGGSVAVKVDGAAVARGAPSGGTLRLRGPAAAAIVAAIGNGRRLTLAGAKGESGAMSLAGASAALRFIDAAQGRVGTVTAAVARGRTPASTVPASLPAPRIPALRVAHGAPASISPALRAQMDKASGCDEEADTPSDIEAQSFALGGGATLVLLPCGGGAYNRDTVPFIVRGGKAMAAEIDYADDGSAGGAAALTNAWWDARTSTLATHAKGRGIGDCGEEATYVWNGSGFRLAALRAMPECRGSTNWLRIWTAEPVYRRGFRAPSGSPAPRTAPARTALPDRSTP